MVELLDMHSIWVVSVMTVDMSLIPAGGGAGGRPVGGGFPWVSRQGTVTT